MGKTDIVTQACNSVGTDLIISHPVVDDPIDYKGLPAIRENHAEFLPFGNLSKLIEASQPTVYFMDDLGQAPPAVQAAAMQLILARRINGYRVSDDVSFIAATNRKSDKAGVAGILEPVKSRFACIVELEPDLNDWVIRNLTKQDGSAFERLYAESTNKKGDTNVHNCGHNRNFASPEVSVTN